MSCDFERCRAPAIAQHRVQHDAFAFTVAFCARHDAMRPRAYYDRAGLALTRTAIEVVPVESPVAAETLQRLRTQPLPSDVRAWLD